jgi:hypothetical protein
MMIDVRNRPPFMRQVEDVYEATKDTPGVTREVCMTAVHVIEVTSLRRALAVAEEALRKLPQPEAKAALEEIDRICTGKDWRDK